MRQLFMRTLNINTAVLDKCAVAHAYVYGLTLADSLSESSGPGVYLRYSNASRSGLPHMF